ncbi:MAG: hypothetical protein KKA55_12035 [Proteobacteria bacterium]|nr:hypothetical protein [Pseudomonadota bacterium]MBU1596247.1 hypothetical protein [Pseudomonadota bacterium]
MPDMADTTITIPVRFDSTGRARNLKVVLRFLLTHLRFPILLGEEGPRPLAPEFLPEFLGRVGYLFTQTHAPYFHKTRCLNRLARAAKTPYLLSHDTDVLAPPQQYARAHGVLAQGADMAFPYDGQCLEVDDVGITRIWTQASLGHLSADTCAVRSARVFGGCVLMRRQAFFEAGMENEHFRAWGLEDDERVARFANLGLRVERVSGPLYHLEHPRPPDQIGQDNPHYQANDQEYRKVAGMAADELKAYIATWPWRNEPQP